MEASENAPVAIGRRLSPHMESLSAMLLGLVFLGSGASLVAAVLLKAQLALLLCITATVAATGLSLKWVLSSGEQRRAFMWQLIVGVTSGVLATLAYDLSRLLFVDTLSLAISPFKAFPIFGELILGKGHSVSTVVTVGAVYHLVNGVAFATSYVLLLGGQRWFCAILWALGLEIAMLLLYPRWLTLEKVLVEFGAMSLVGHLCYGVVLGVCSEAALPCRYPLDVHDTHSGANGC